MENTKDVKSVINASFNQIMRICVALIVGVFIGYCIRMIQVRRASNKVEEVISVDETIIDENSVLSISTVESLVKETGDLVSTYYEYKDADTWEKYKDIKGIKIPFTNNKVVFTYRGRVGIGLDIEKVTYKIDDEHKVITVSLPEMEIIYNELQHDSFEVPYESKALFNRNDMSDYTELFASLQENKRKEVLKDDALMKTAKDNAEHVIQEFLTVAETTKDYKVVFD